jgi:Signal transduction histidine kinase
MLPLHLPGQLAPDDAARLAALARTGLLDSPPEERFDRLTALAALVLGTPVALIALVDAKRSFFKSAFGVEEALGPLREVPLTHSICRYVVAEQAPIVMEDARLDPLFRDNGAVREHGAVAYAGMPILDGEGHALGALCVIDGEPRRWTQRDLATIRLLADWVSKEIARGDAGARAEAEREERARFAALGRLAATIAHDFNNVLSAVGGYADLLQSDGTLPESARQDVAEIVQAAERGRVLTKQLAAVARRPKTTLGPVIVNEVVRAAARVVEDAAGAPIALSLSLAPELPPVHADAAQLAKVLAQIMANARDAMPAGGPLAVATVLVTEADASTVQITVRDSGSGMDGATRERCFEPFFTTRRDSGHRGVGLTMARAYILEMNGRIAVESLPGQGTAVVVTLRTRNP